MNHGENHREKRAKYYLTLKKIYFKFQRSLLKFGLRAGANLFVFFCILLSCYLQRLLYKK